MGLWYPSQFSPTRTLPLNPSQQLLSSAALTVDYPPCYSSALPTAALLPGDGVTLVDSRETTSRLRALASPSEPWSVRGAAAPHQQTDFTRTLLPLARLDLRAGGCGAAFGTGCSEAGVRLGHGVAFPGSSLPHPHTHPLALSRSSTGCSLAVPPPQQQQQFYAPVAPAAANVLRRVPEEQSFV